MSSSYRKTLDLWLKELDVRADRVLDIGGSQLPVRGRTKSWEVGEYLIADLPEPHIGSPKPDIEMNLNMPIWVMPEESANLIFCLEVFDYVWNPYAALCHIEAYLANGGTAWVSFPSFYPTHQPIEDDALRYMEGGIRKLAEASGLTIVQMIRRKPETNMLDQFFRAERLRAAKHYDHEFIGWIVEFKK